MRLLGIYTFLYGFRVSDVIVYCRFALGFRVLGLGRLIYHI